MPRLVKIRLSGTADDTQALALRLQAAPELGIAECSAPYPNRRDGGVRLYLTAVPDSGEAAPPGSPR